MAKVKTSKKAKPNSYPKWIWLVWLLLAVLSIWWAQERLLYQDSAFGLFRITNLEMPIEHSRWGIAPLWFPAYCAAWMHLPLIGVVTILSFTGILIPAVTSWVMWRVNQEHQSYLLPLFLITVTGPEWFFLGIVDMVPALCYCCLFFAFLMRTEGWKQYHIYAALLSLFLAFHSHPGVLPLLLFIPCFYFAYTKNRIAFVAFIAVFLVAILKKYIAQNSPYETEVLGRASISSLQHIFDSWTWGYFLHSFVARLLIPTALFFGGLLLLRKRLQSYSWIYLTLLAVGGAFSIIAIFASGDNNLMMEKNFAPVVLVLCIPILCLSLRSPGLHNLYLFLAICLAGFGIWERFNAFEFYHQRLSRMEALLQDKNVRNHEMVYYPESKIDPEAWRVTWAFPYESLLKSVINNEKATTIKLYGKEPDQRILTDSGHFYGADFAYKIKTDTMNTRYFRFPTNSKYYLVKDNSVSKP